MLSSSRLGAPFCVGNGLQISWQAQHFLHLGVHLRGMGSLWQLPGGIGCCRARGWVKFRGLRSNSSSDLRAALGHSLGPYDPAGASTQFVASMWHHLDGLPGSVLRQQWIRLLVPWIGNFFERPRNLASLNRLRIYVDYILMRTGLHTGSMHFGLLLSLCAFTIAFANVSHVFSQEALESFRNHIRLIPTLPASCGARPRTLCGQGPYGSRHVIVPCTSNFMNRPRQSWSSSPAPSLSLVFHAFFILCLQPLRTLRFYSAVLIQPSNRTRWVQWISPPNTRSLEERLAWQPNFSVCIFSNLGLLCHARALAFARTAHELPSSLTLAFTVRSSRSAFLPGQSRHVTRFSVFCLACMSVGLSKSLCLQLCDQEKTRISFFICLAMPEPDPEAFAAFMANFQQMTAENQRRLAQGTASLASAREQSQSSPSMHSAQTAETKAMPQTADAQPSHEPSPITPAEVHPGRTSYRSLCRPSQSPGQMHWPPTLLALSRAQIRPTQPSRKRIQRRQSPPRMKHCLQQPLKSPALRQPQRLCPKHGHSLRRRRALRNLHRIRLPRWMLRRCQTRLCLRLPLGTARGTNRRAFGHRTLLRLFTNRSRKRGRAASAGAGVAAGGTISLAFRASSRQPKPQGLALSIMPSRSTRIGVKIDAFLGRRLRHPRPGRPPRTRPGPRCLRPLPTMSIGPKRTAMPLSSSAQPSAFRALAARHAWESGPGATTWTTSAGFVAPCPAPLAIALTIQHVAALSMWAGRSTTTRTPCTTAVGAMSDTSATSTATALGSHASLHRALPALRCLVP